MSLIAPGIAVLNSLWLSMLFPRVFLVQSSTLYCTTDFALSLYSMLHMLNYVVVAFCSSDEYYNAISQKSKIMLYITAMSLFASVLSRDFPMDNIFWAVVACIYAFKIKKQISLVQCLAWGIMAGSSVLLGFLIIEISARFFCNEILIQNECFIPHDESVFTLKSNSQDYYLLEHNNGEIERIERVISSQGIRNRELNDKTPDEIRISLLGDSFTMGDALHLNQTIASKLQEYLNQQDLSCKATVINCGVAGYAPWQEHIFLLERVFPLKPDTVILQLFPPNDISGSLTKESKYLKSVDPMEYRIYAYRHKNEIPFLLERLAQKYFQGYRLFLKAVNQMYFISPFLYNLRLYPRVGFPEIILDPQRDPFREACLVTWYSELYQAWNIYKNSIKDIRDDCAKRNINLIAYVHGDRFSLHPEAWKTLNNQDLNISYEMNKDIRLTKTLLENLKIPYINMTDILSSSIHKPEEIYFKIDGHFTPLGAEIVAKELALYLISREFPWLCRGGSNSLTYK